MMKSIRRLVAIQFLLLIAMSPIEAAAQGETGQQKSCPCPTAPRHLVGGHYFQPSLAIPSAFANSTAAVVIAFGYGTYSTTLADDLKLGGFFPRAEGSISIFDRAAFTFGVTGNLIAGLNSPSVISYGASTGINWRIGGIYELMRSSQTVLSVALDFEKPRRFSVSPLEAAESAVRELLGGANQSFVSNLVSTRWRPNLRFAHALNSNLGIQAMAGFKFDATRENEVKSSQDVLQVGAGLEYELGPVGIAASYLHGQALDSDASDSNAITLGIYDSVQKGYFDVGIEAGVVRSGGVNTILGGVVIKTYYN